MPTGLRTGPYRFYLDDVLGVALMGGRTISVPLVWHPRLLNASEKERQIWQVGGGGYGIHLPVVDGDLSTDRFSARSTGASPTIRRDLAAN
jgi:hypothetical protein